MGMGFTSTGDLAPASFPLSHFSLSFSGVLKTREQRPLSFFKEKQVAGARTAAVEKGLSICNTIGRAGHHGKASAHLRWAPRYQCFLFLNWTGKDI